MDGKKILVLCSATGEVVFWLAELMEQGQVMGLELDSETLEIARSSAHEMGLDQVVIFLPAEETMIPLPASSFDAIVSEFIVHPTTSPTQIGQIEMARVLKPGGKMILTDVISTLPLPDPVRQELTRIGLDYIWDATPGDIQGWMTDAGMIHIDIKDMTSIVQNAWEDRSASDQATTHLPGYAFLLDDLTYGLGKAIRYIYAYGEKA
jgi:ubiquinone/menaquinone biosynthesis C-methylase UbiE